MQLNKKECVHFSEVLGQTKEALLKKDSIGLRNLSDQTIHSACSYQNPGSITSAVVIYALSKIIERGDYSKIEKWDSFVKKFNALLDLAIQALEKNLLDSYEEKMEKARKMLESHSINLRPYIQEIIKKAAINKGSKLYEHGLSLERTAQLLGVSQWELSDYVGQKSISREQETKTIDTKERVRIAMEFFE